MASIEELRRVRLEKLEKLRRKGLDPYPASVRRTHKIHDVLKGFLKLSGAKKPLAVVGRVRGVRLHGGAAFLDIEDGTGTVQIFCEEKKLGKEAYEVVSKLTDIGDFAEVSGSLFVTKKKEKTLRAASFRIIAKALRPTPEEHFGLKDTEERLRRRYLDLIANKETRELFIKKAAFWKSVREYLNGNGFLEVDTPALEDVPGGADARPFITHHDALDRDFYLRISLELPLKKIIIGGFEKVYEIGKIFRNEGISAEHLQDYLQCEFYWAYADYEDMADFVEKLFQYAVKETTGSVEAGGVHWGGTWPRRDYREILEEYGIDLSGLTTDAKARTYAAKEGLGIAKEWGRGRVIDYIWKKKVRPHIKDPIFVTHHPVEVSPLAKRLAGDPTHVERLQVVAAGTELGNGWSELNDPVDQRTRFEEQQKLRERGDAEAQMKNEEFIEALEYGMPPAAGFGFSERLFAVLMGRSIRETVIFPPMRRETPES